MEMSYNLWFVHRESFCWLNDNEVVVVSYDNKRLNGHCELLDTVSREHCILPELLWAKYI